MVELAKVYVSSTIADLTEERQAVLDWLRPARHQAVDSYLPDSDTAARDQLAALLPVRERVLGAEHPDTLTDCTDLAYWIRQAESQPEPGVD